jgi:hypothetical protein
LGERSAEHHAKHIPPVGPERHANPDLVVSPCHGESCYAIQADAGQDECQQADEPSLKSIS